MDAIEHFKSAADEFIREAGPISHINLGYNLESVEWLEGYIERLRKSGQFKETDQKFGLVGVFGSFLGECVIHNYGGAWRERSEGWRVEFRKDTYVLPFSKVSKQLDNGLSDGIGWFFRAIPIVILPLRT
jgi:hypothetical protein